jgi:hypothetical protein
MCPDSWCEWLHSFRERLIAAKGWSDKKAKLRIRDAWVCVRGQVHVLTNDAPRPVDAVPAFQVLTPGGWKTPIEILERLTGLITKAMTSERSPRDIVLGLLSYVEHSDDPDESDEIKQKRHNAAYWGHQLLDACEDATLSGVVDSDVFWQVVLYAFQAGRRHEILDRYLNPQALADLLKAQAFQSGRAPDELSRHLEASFLELQTMLGRDPKPREVVKAAGGRWDDIDNCWEFDDIDGLPSVTHRGLCERLKVIRRIRRKHRT